MKKPISVEQAAQIIGVSERQVRRMITVGTLRAVEVSPRARVIEEADARRLAKDRPKAGNPNFQKKSE